MKKSIIYTLLFSLSVFIACKEENPLHPYGKNDGKAPMDVSNIQVVNTPGGAVVKYDTPSDSDLSYVKAIYYTQGKEMEVRSSKYIDSLVIAGLGTTDEYDIRLYSVDIHENISTGVDAKIKPLTPPVWQVRESLSYWIDFGGFYVDFENPTGNDIAIYTLVKEENSEDFAVYDSYYTKQKNGPYAVRGLPDKENTFGLYARDRYDNMSDTLYFSGTPLREDYLDKKLFANMTVAGDVTWDHHNGKPERAWDDIISNSNYAHTAYPTDFPHRFTIDLGVDVKLGRFRLWQRPGAGVFFEHGAPKHYKVYGRPDRPTGGDISNPMEGWTLLMECHSFKPSGLPMGQTSSEDEEYNMLGEEFVFPREGMPVIRYLRFEMLESWSGMQCSVISELAFWGEIQE